MTHSPPQSPVNAKSRVGTYMASRDRAAPRVGLVGVHGYGARHLDNVLRLQDAGCLELSAIADPSPPDSQRLPPNTTWHGSLGELLASGDNVDIVIIATPIHTHMTLALQAIEAGADIYLEKPAVASLEQYRILLSAAQQHGRVIQVGFQSLGSLALPAIDSLIDSGEIGAVRGVSATGLWVRDRAYYARSAWAGRRILDGADVVDGVATNPLAHAVATALRIAHADTTNHVSSIDTDLYRAHEIDADDTAMIRIRTHDGTTIMCGLTLCADESSDPVVTIEGTDGRAVLYYTRDILEVENRNEGYRLTFGRHDLLENLMHHRENGIELISPLERAGAFTQVVDAIRTADNPKPIGSRHVTWVGAGPDAHPVIAGIRESIERATAAQATFSELGTAWARPQSAPTKLFAAGRPVARHRDGSQIRTDSSARPYLHPVTTLAGTSVTDHLPLDHIWHLGTGVAVQDVKVEGLDGVNFWGGRTYVRDAGYMWLQDHGTVSQERRDDCGKNEAGASALLDSSSLRESLNWTASNGRVLLTEDRSWSCAGVTDSVWELTLKFSLRPVSTETVTLGSPGSNGREGGGYGGFFWRLPPCRVHRIHTPDADGEGAVHGHWSPWLAWHANFDVPFPAIDSTGTDDTSMPTSRDATLVFVAPPEAADPWFVRNSSYTGVGSALAWESPIAMTADEPVTRTIRVIIADGELSETRIEEMVASS